mmetsp:Transcript_36074/g.36503  ORF Transcript_36074/g.36503 Transcript_36074/m.36503 type:complete len:149 (-) Transcript_36074:144-590(-)
MKIEIIASICFAFMNNGSIMPVTSYLRPLATHRLDDRFQHRQPSARRKSDDRTVTADSCDDKKCYLCGKTNDECLKQFRNCDESQDYCRKQKKKCIKGVLSCFLACLVEMSSEDEYISIDVDGDKLEDKLEDKDEELPPILVVEMLNF